MPDLFSLLFSAVIYVLQALGLYTLAQRRGIRNAWLAWIPVGCIWIIGSLADDFKKKAQGKTEHKRIWATVLTALTSVLAVATLVVMLTSVLMPVLEAVGYEEMYNFLQISTMDPNGMYGPVLQEQMLEMEQRLNDIISEQMAAEILRASVISLGLSVALLVVSIAAAILQYLCLYELFCSCDPRNKVLYLFLSLLFGVSGVIIFLCRNRDDGMLPQPQGLPGGQQPPNYWQQQ